MPYLTSLPTEVLVIIFSFISSPRVYFHLALACKRLNALVRPFQYRAIELSLPASPYPRAATESGNARKFDNLLKTLNTDDLLRLKVVALSVTIWRKNRSDWCEESATLAHVLPSLGSLRLSPPPMTLSLSSHTLLHSLYFDFRDFNLHHWLKPLWLDVSHSQYLSRYLWLPSLRNLYTKRLDLEEMIPNDSLPQHRRRTSPVTTLRLRDCEHQTIGVLSSILGSIRALEIFTLDFYTPYNGSCEALHLSTVHSVGLSLADHAETLVELIIASSDVAWFHGISLFGSMTHYTALKRLGIPEHFLATPREISFPRHLPSGLVVLQLQYPMRLLCFNRVIRQDHPYRILRLRTLAAQKAKDYPLLARLIFWEQPEERMAGTMYGALSDFQLLEAELGEQNVDFTFVSSPFYAGTPLAAEEFEGEEMTRWNVPSENQLSLTELYGS